MRNRLATASPVTIQQANNSWLQVAKEEVWTVGRESMITALTWGRELNCGVNRTWLGKDLEAPSEFILFPRHLERRCSHGT